MVLAGAGIGNSTSLTDIQKESLEQINEQMMEQNMVNNSLSKMVKSAMSSTMAKNASSLQAIVRQTNSIVLSAPPEGCPPLTKIVIRNVKQTNNLQLQAISKSVNDVTIKIQQDIKKSIEDSTEQMASYADNKSLGSTFGDMVGKGFEALESVSGDVASVMANAGGGAGIGNSYDNTRISEDQTVLKNKYGLKEIAEINKEDLEDLSLQDELKAENINNMINEVLQANGMEFNGVCPTSFEMENVEQLNAATMKIESETINKLSKDIADKYEKNLKVVLEKMLEKSTDETSGDIAQLGTATAMVVAEGGEAGAKIIDSAGDAGAKVLDSGLGGIGGILGGNFVMYAVIGVVAVALIAAVLFMIRPSVAGDIAGAVTGKGSDAPGGDFGGEYGGEDFGGEPYSSKYFSSYLN